jgi:hypothetical protein
VIDPEECIDCFAPTRSFSRRRACDLRRDREPVVPRRDRRRLQAAYVGASGEAARPRDVRPAFEERDRYGGTRLTTATSRGSAVDVLATPTHSLVLADGDRTDSLESAFRASASATQARTRRLPPRRPARARVRRRQLEQARRPLRRATPLRASSTATKLQSTATSSTGQLLASLDVHPGYAEPASFAPRRTSSERSRDADPEYIAGFVDGWLAPTAIR